MNEKNVSQKTMGEIEFSEDKKTLIRFPKEHNLKFYIIPNHVQLIGAEAFKNIKGLHEIVIPNSVQLISYKAFWNFECYHMTILNPKVKFGQDVFWNVRYDFLFIPKKSTKLRDILAGKFNLKSENIIYEEMEFKNASQEDLDFEKKVVEAAIDNNGYAFQFIRAELKKDLGLLKRAIKSGDGKIFGFSHLSNRRDSSIIEELIDLSGYAIKFAIGNYMNNRKYILKAAKTCPYVLLYISDSNFKKEMSKDAEVVLNSLNAPFKTAYYGPLEWADIKFKIDRNVVLNAVKVNGLNLKSADSQFYTDREIIYHGIEDVGFMLDNLPHKFKDDEELVLRAISKFPSSIQYASDRIKNNDEIAFRAVNASAEAYRHISDRLKRDKKFVLEYIKQKGFTPLDAWEQVRTEDGKYYQSVNKELNQVYKNEIEVYQLRIKKRNQELLNKDTSAKLKNDKQFVLRAVTKNGLRLQFASAKLRRNKEIILAAVSNNGLAYKFVDFGFK
tara:strand:- start:2787 stop:4286 length:1500 start_codon:yes stop_codon:yes gene_type:complete